MQSLACLTWTIRHATLGHAGLGPTLPRPTCHAPLMYRFQPVADRLARPSSRPRTPHRQIVPDKPLHTRSVPQLPDKPHQDVPCSSTHRPAVSDSTSLRVPAPPYRLDQVASVSGSRPRHARVQPQPSRLANAKSVINPSQDRPRRRANPCAPTGQASHSTDGPRPSWYRFRYAPPLIDLSRPSSSGLRPCPTRLAYLWPPTGSSRVHADQP